MQLGAYVKYDRNRTKERLAQLQKRFESFPAGIQTWIGNGRTQLIIACSNSAPNSRGSGCEIDQHENKIVMCPKQGVPEFENMRMATELGSVITFQVSDLTNTSACAWVKDVNARAILADLPAAPNAFSDDQLRSLNNILVSTGDTRFGFAVLVSLMLLFILFL